MIPQIYDFLYHLFVSDNTANTIRQIDNLSLNFRWT